MAKGGEMAIVRKPAAVPERAVEAVINQARRVPSRSAKVSSRASRTPVVVRFESGLLERVDAAVAARDLPITRHSWILEALHEKALRESA